MEPAFSHIATTGFRGTPFGKHCTRVCLPELAVIAKIKSRTTNNLSSEKLRVLQSLGDIREI
jgi:hypothetical protein